MGPSAFDGFLRRSNKQKAKIPATEITGIEIPTAIPIVLLLLDEDLAALLLDVADGGLIARTLVWAFSTNKHWDNEKLLRSQSTIRYLE